MSFNKRILPDLDNLMKIREEIGNDRQFIKQIIGKSDCLMGSRESLNFIEEIEKSLEDIKK